MIEEYNVMEKTAWVTGIIEGEGSFYVESPQRKSPKGKAVFKLEMTDEDVVEAVAKFFGEIGVFTDVKRVESRGTGKDGTPWKPSYVIRVRAASDLVFLTEWFGPWSSKKQDDVWRVLKNLNERGLV